jgi:hypothetical protein
MQFSDVKPFEDREATIQMIDGEQLRAKIVFVDSEYDDVIVDVLETNRPAQYRTVNQKCSYALPLSELVAIF